MVAIGCGRFAEADWAEYLFDEARATALARHVAQCPLCREEARLLRRTEAALRAVGPEDPAVRDVFSRSVVAEHMARRAKAPPASGKRRVPPAVRGWTALAAAASVCLMLVAGRGAGLWPWQRQEAAPFVSISYGTVAEDAQPAQPLTAGALQEEATFMVAADDSAARVLTDGVTAGTTRAAAYAQMAAATPVLSADGAAHVTLTVARERGDS